MVAYIPKEKILFQGDFSLPAPGQPGNDHVKALVPALEKLKLVDFERYINAGAATLHGASNQIPASTRAVPAAIQGVNGSPRSAMLRAIVDSGPIMPVCAVTPGPTRSIAIITSTTGKTVQRTALRIDSQITCGATNTAENGLSTRNCTMHRTQATLVANPVTRNVPMVLIALPLRTIYNA
jgi:hypothetical protein